MGDAPCGCELLERAKRAGTESGRRALERNARAQQARWQCPCAGFPEPDLASPSKLDPECRVALSATERVTGLPTTECRTCPRWYAAQTFAIETADARVAAERGELRTFYGDDPPSVLLDAVKLLDRAIGERYEREHEERERKHAEQRAKDERARR